MVLRGSYCSCWMLLMLASQRWSPKSKRQAVRAAAFSSEQSDDWRTSWNIQSAALLWYCAPLEVTVDGVPVLTFICITNFSINTLIIDFWSSVDALWFITWIFSDRKFDCWESSLDHFHGVWFIPAASPLHWPHWGVVWRILTTLLNQFIWSGGQMWPCGGELELKIFPCVSPYRPHTLIWLCRSTTQCKGGVFPSLNQHDLTSQQVTEPEMVLFSLILPVLISDSSSSSH